MKIVHQASSITEAHIVAGLLRTEGIAAHVGGYYLQGGVGELAPMDFANVQVADEDASRARDIVAAWEARRGSAAYDDAAHDDTLRNHGRGMAGALLAILSALSVAGLLLLLAR